MILPQSARKLADSSLREGAQRNVLTEVLSSLVEGGAELAR